ncbi:LysE family translocator [Vibrio sp. JC009]|uniref:LysE family translocator n=1 Tax=Vibrio sp. JC009 TaxID=2912314 RepID=UPI0023B156E6|nr:LysE family translocator [Vibrio sp. JC009]WED24825.1 LysE family translocator [Vibrio sp. JC009]
MSFEGAITFFVAIFVFSVTPGPGVFAMLARALVHGSRSCLALALGMVASDVVYLIMACFGLATIAENWSEVFVVIRYVGAAYLIYLGYKMFKTLPAAKQTIESEPQKLREISNIAGFTQGFLISASNPKVILFYIAFLPTFIDLTVLQAQDIALAASLASVALTLGLMLIAYGAARASQLLKTPVAHRRLNRSAGGIMILAGTYLAVSR